MSELLGHFGALGALLAMFLFAYVAACTIALPLCVYYIYRDVRRIRRHVEDARLDFREFCQRISVGD